MLYLLVGFCTGFVTGFIILSLLALFSSSKKRDEEYLELYKKLLNDDASDNHL